MTVADMKISDASSVSMEENGADRAAADMAKASIIEKNSGLYRPVTIGSLELPGNIFLAPAAGYSDKSFRSICVDWGADFTYTEMVSSEAYIRNSVKTEKLIERGHSEQRYAVQIFGANPEFMAETAVRIIERYRRLRKPARDPH